ncbi:zinc finger CCCH domain-containing protein 3-like [Ochlerotatus camptorhynchus]|uniref:zinc finger CCCH domain-containing protein 3-like n=1 Tax=Ochlerotatus camptorhynchus TaxID=644619 RepID=UPI0031E08D95
MDATESRTKIFINPEFKKAHINRNFLSKTFSAAAPTETPAAAVLQPNIHFNPAFLERLSLQRNQEQIDSQKIPTTSSPAKVLHQNPIIKHTKRKLIRACSVVPSSAATSCKVPLVAPLVKISRNKLVRSVPSTAAAQAAKTLKSDGVRIVEKQFHTFNGSNQQYKLDRRPGTLRTIFKPKSSIRRFSLVRTNSIVPQSVVVTDRRLLKLNCNRPPLKIVTEKLSRKMTFTSQNKKLVMININGVLYRSSSNKLQVSSARSPAKILPRKPPADSTNSKQRCLTIRGTRFMLDPSGTKLRKMPSVEVEEPHQAKLGRIDIGGLTYMPKTDGTFVRTDTHRTRSYLSLTKHKSIQVLTNRMRKCNVPCPIYRRLGKCTAFVRGKCPKLHDKNQIMICFKFLKGECVNEDCLLSHNVSLEKMPVCHFFLEGRCTKNDCPYLHKKVSEKERICEDFLKGFCSVADKCPRRHEFICPEIDRFGVCEQANCPYPHSRRHVERKQHETVDERVNPTKSTPVKKGSQQGGPVSAQRYYFNNPNESSVNDSTELTDGQRAQLKNMLVKVDKMKQGHLEEATGANNVIVDKKNLEEIEINSDEDEHMQTSDDEDSGPPIMKRAKLGPLPSFIPI